MTWGMIGGAAVSVVGGKLLSGSSKGGSANPQSFINAFPGALNAVQAQIPQSGFGTGFSTLNPRTGALSMDPLGRNLNLQGLDTYANSLGDIQNSLMGNQGALMQARVNPVLERLAAGRGQLQRGLGQTGVRGTFANQTMQNYDINAGRAEGDARAIAQSETTNAMAQIAQNLFGAQQGTASNIFTQELQGLQLSTATMQNLLSIAANLSTGAGSNAVALQGNQGTQNANAANMFGSIIGPSVNALGGALGNYFSPTPTSSYTNMSSLGTNPGQFNPYRP